MSSISITKRKNKTGFVWQYRFEIGSVDGKRQWESKSGFATRKEALEAGKKAQQIYDNTGRVLKQTDMTYSDLLEYWLEHEVSQTCKPNTVENYRKKIRLHIKPELGKYRIRTITRQNLRDFLLKLYNEGFSLNTISVYRGILTKSFHYAVDSGFLAVSPAENIQMPKSGGLPPRTPTRTQPHVYIPADKMAEILERFPEGSSCHLPLMLGYHCGLRLGEVFALTWEDIDLERRILSVNRQVQWNAGKENGYWYFSAPKYESYRAITIDPAIAELLAREKENYLQSSLHTENYVAYYAEHPLQHTGVKPDKPPAFNKIRAAASPGRNRNETGTEEKDEGEKWEVHFINVRKNGKYNSPWTLKHASSVIHQELHFPEFDFHSLRHTHATVLMEHGAQLVYIQRRLGHANIKMTQNIYTNHLTDEIRFQGDSVLDTIYSI